MAEVSTTKVREKKAGASAVIATPSGAKKKASDGASVIADETPVALLPTLEDMIVKAFKDEFKGMPYTELSVIVRCGTPNMPTYQEIEIPAVTQLLMKHRTA